MQGITRQTCRAKRGAADLGWLQCGDFEVELELDLSMSVADAIVVLIRR